MRLHNRQIKAGFWTDADVTEWSMAKRLFYLGLIQLADDSGCIEDNPRLLKGGIFPYDEGVSVATVTEWLTEFIAQGKLQRYTAGRKTCLFLLNFHTHQTLRQPSPPEVPLPAWITWEPFRSNSHTGRYVISKDTLMNKQNPAYEVTEYCFQPEPEHEPEPEPEHEPEHEPEYIAQAQTSAIAETIGCEELVDFEIATAIRLGQAETPTGNGRAPPLSEGQKLYLEKFGRKRFGTADQKNAIGDLERDVGPDVFLKALTWAAENNISKVGSIRTAAKKMQSNKEATNATHNRERDGTDKAKPGKYAGIGAVFRNTD